MTRSGRFEEAVAIQRASADALAADGDRRMEGQTRTYLADALSRMGEDESAQVEVERALDLLVMYPPTRVPALAIAARIRRVRGDVATALGLAREACTILEEIGQIEEGDALVRLEWAESLDAAGSTDEARRALADARDRLKARADRIDDVQLRESFLSAIPDNQRTLLLAREWGV